MGNHGKKVRCENPECDRFTYSKYGLCMGCRPSHVTSDEIICNPESVKAGMLLVARLRADRAARGIPEKGLPVEELYGAGK